MCKRYEEGVAEARSYNFPFTRGKLDRTVVSQFRRTFKLNHEDPSEPECKQRKQRKRQAHVSRVAQAFEHPCEHLPLQSPPSALQALPPSSTLPHRTSTTTTHHFNHRPFASRQLAVATT